ncbi:hypothetical protein L0F63_001610 [Massospora cicadina]|nr:hypothetical protein L0F63_001610 [Massospora cicadina]
MNSCLEAISSETPILGLPFSLDQPKNIAKMVHAVITAKEDYDLLLIWWKSTPFSLRRVALINRTIQRVQYHHVNLPTLFQLANRCLSSKLTTLTYTSSLHSVA